MKKIIVLIFIVFFTIKSYSQFQTWVWREGENQCLDFSTPSNLDNLFPFEISIDSISDGNFEQNFSGYSIITDTAGNITSYISANSAYLNGIWTDLTPLYNIDKNKLQNVLVTTNNLGVPTFYFVSNDTLKTTDLLSTVSLFDTPVLPKFTALVQDNDTIFALHSSANFNYIFYNTNGNSTIIPGGNYTISDSGFFKFSAYGEYFAASYPESGHLDLINLSSYNIQTISGKSFNAIAFAPFTNVPNVNQILYAADEYNIYQICLMNNNSTNLTLIDSTSSRILDMHVSLDGRIFVTKEDGSIGIIEVPEIRGPDCNYIDNYMTPNEPIICFPNLPINPDKKIQTFFWIPTSVDTTDTVNFSTEGFYDYDSIKCFVDGVRQDTNNYFFSYRFHSYGQHEIKAKVYFMNSFEHIWDSLAFIKHINVKSKMPDIVICDTNDSSILRFNFDATDYIWHRLVDGNVDWRDTTFDNYITVHQPGIYTVEALEYQDTIRDTAYAIYFEPYIENLPDTIALGSTITINANINSIPANTVSPTDVEYWWILDSSVFSHDIGDTSVSVHFNSQLNHIVKVQAMYDGCVHTYSKNIFVKTSAVQFHLNITDTLLCDTLTDFVLKLVSDYGILWNIVWTLPDASEIHNIDSIIVHKPGKYFVQIFAQNGALIFQDSCFAHYDYCEKLNISATVNDLPAVGFCDKFDSYKFAIVADNLTNPCGFTTDLRTYRWDFGNNDFYESPDNTTEYNFPGIGSYHVISSVIDAKGCEHHISTNVAIANEADSVESINLTEKNVYGAYIVDIEKLRLFEQPQPAKSFYKVNFNNNNVIVPGAVNDYDIPISVPNDISINSNQIKIMLDIALAGKFNISLITPDNLQIFLMGNSGDNYPLFGYPNLDYISNNDTNVITQLYYLKLGGENLSDYIQSADSTDYYYQPNGKTALGTFYHIAPLSEFDISDSLDNIPLNGDWSIRISGTYSYGYLKSAGILFPPDFASIRLLPDSVTCTDDYGNTFKTNDYNKMYFYYIGIDEMKYHCKAYYRNCEKDKVLEVQYPEVANTFTPNGDNINDTWMPISPEIDADIIILDKTGTIVDEFNTSEAPEGWTGYYMNGEIAPNDSYWAIITLKNGTIIKKIVNIIR